MRKLLCILLCVFMFISCENRDHGHEATETTSTSKTEYNAIKSLGYIGGSVVFNPENPSTSQLREGADIAFYLSKMDEVYVPATVYDMYGSEMLEGGLMNSFVYDEDSDVYGYLHVDRVSSNDLRLTVNTYSADGATKKTTSYTLEAEKSLDLNGDGKPDLKYTKLLPIREGFNGAMCLEFVSSQEGLYASMYATMPEGTLTKTAKTLTGYENKTFYGVNSNGDFIYIVSNNDIDAASKTIKSTADVVGISHGDYVIDQDTGEIMAVVGTKGANAGTYALKETEDFANSAEDSVIPENTPAILEEFLTYFYDINQFASAEGPKNLVKELPEELLLLAYNYVEEKTETKLPDNFYDNDSDFYINILNGILFGPFGAEPFYMISDAEGIPLTEEDENNLDNLFYAYVRALYVPDIAEQIIAAYDSRDLVLADQLVKDNPVTEENCYDPEGVQVASLYLIASMRTYIENIYPESPRAIVLVPELSTVYPLMSVNIGEIPEHLDQTKSIDGSDVSKSKANSFQEYVDNKKKIDEEFDEFYSISLSSIKIEDYEKKDSNDKPNPTVSNKKKSEDKEKDNSVEVEAESIHFDLALGVTGSLHTSWGNLECGLGTAIYVSTNANFRELEQNNIKLWDKELADPSKTFFIGPVPITVGVDVGVELRLDAAVSTPINFFTGFTGMYGGSVEFNADYGLKFKTKYHIPYPTGYFNPSFKAHGINYTTYYAGRVDDGGILDMDLNLIKIVLKPSINAEPKVAIGPKYAYAGISAPSSIGVNLGIGLFSEKYLEADDPYSGSATEQRQTNYESLIDDYWVPGLEIQDCRLFEKLSVGTNIDIGPVLGVKIPKINKKAEIKWTAATIFEAEFAYTSRGFEYKGSFGPIEFDSQD